MAIITRVGKGTALTHIELDNNFTDLDTRLEVAEAELPNIPGTLQEVTDVGAVSTNAITVPGIQLDIANPVTTITEGMMTWNSVDQTLDVGLEDGISVMQVGQESLLHARNNDPGTILNGTVVRIDGATGQRPTVTIASNNDPINSVYNTIGLATTDVDPGSSGYFTTRGLVRNLNTSAFAEGAQLWLGQNGDITDTRPVFPESDVRVGWCVRSNSSNGILYIDIRIAPDLSRLHDVDTAVIIDGDSLVWDDELFVWIAQPASAYRTAIELAPLVGTSVSRSVNTITTSNAVDRFDYHPQLDVLVALRDTSVNWGDLIISEDDGETWNETLITANKDTYDFYRNPDTGRCAVYTPGSIAYYSDNLSSWSSRNANTFLDGAGQYFPTWYWDFVNKTWAGFTSNGIVGRTTTWTSVSKTSSNLYTILNNTLPDNSKGSKYIFSRLLKKHLLFNNTQPILAASSDMETWTAIWTASANILAWYEVDKKVYVITSDDNITSTKDGITWKIEGTLPTGVGGTVPEYVTAVPQLHMILANFNGHGPMFTANGRKWFDIPDTAQYSSRAPYIVPDLNIMLLADYTTNLANLDIIRASR